MKNLTLVKKHSYELECANFIYVLFEISQRVLVSHKLLLLLGLVYFNKGEKKKGKNRQMTSCLFVAQIH